MQVPATATRQGGGIAYKWVVAMVTVVGVFMAILDSTIVNIAIPRLQTAFGADLHSVQWVLTGYLLAQAVGTPVVAFFSDRLGIKRFYIISLAAFTVGSALCGLSWSLPTLIFFRVLQGLGGAALFPLSMTLIFREFPPQERGSAMGLFGVPALLAPALGPTLGGYIVTYAGWPLIFFINVPIGIVAVVLSMIFLREFSDNTHNSFDVLGFIFSAVGLGTLLYGLSNASTDGWGSVTVLGFMGVGILALFIFVVVELMIVNRGGQPLLDLRVFANRSFLTSTIASVLVVFALYGGLFLLPVYLQSLRGESAFQAGLILLPQALASMVATVVSGRLVDRIGVRAIVIPGLLVLAFANWQLSFLTINSPFGWLQLILVLRGLALGLTMQPLMVSAMAEIRPQLLAQASSMSTAVRFVASSLGIAILATLVQTQTKIHFDHLAEQVTANSPIGQMLPRLQALFVAHGADLATARTTALQMIAQLVQRQGYVLAIQDAFVLTLVFVIVSVIATFFVSGSRRQPAPAGQSGQEERTAAHAEMELALV